MLGLKLAAIENGMDVPEIFMDGSWSRSSHMKLSTSQVRARNSRQVSSGAVTLQCGLCAAEGAVFRGLVAGASSRRDV